MIVPMLLDTHALVFWNIKEGMDDKLFDFLDTQSSRGNVFVSSISFWELSLLNKKGRIAIENIRQWKDDILNYSGVRLLEPSIDDMIASVELPDYHKDPFDRLLIAQAIRHQIRIVTKDALFERYPVERFWG